MKVTKKKNKDPKMMENGEDIKYGSLAKKDMEGVLKAVRTTFGQTSIMRMNENTRVDGVEVISTGSLKVDEALGIGGLPKGRVVEIYGPQGGGKTTLALSAVAAVQRKEDENGEKGKAAFIDAEHALDASLAKSVGVDVDELYVVQPDYGEQGLDILHMLVASQKFDIIILDSVAALVPRVEIEGEMSDANIGAMAKMMGKALRKITPAVSKSSTLVIFINQMRQKIGVMFGSPDTTPGGKALPFFASVRIDIRAIGKIKQGEKVLGNKVKVNIVKNKLAPPCKVITTDLIFGKGFSKESELFDVAVELGIIDKSGSHYSFGEDRLANGRLATIEKLVEVPEFFNRIEAAVKAKDVKFMDFCEDEDEDDE